MRRLTTVVVAGAGAVTAAAVAARSPRFRRQSRRVWRAMRRVGRYRLGRLEGWWYRASGRHPDPAVGETVLADRVRSMLGPVEHRLDVPRVLVQAQGHEVLIHGDVDSEAHAAEIVGVVRGIPGVEQVTSHLHVGLFRGDSRPSEGTNHHGPSSALAGMLVAAKGGGAPPGGEEVAARSVLSAFTSLLPPGECRHVLGHLPADLRRLAEPGVAGWTGHRPRRVDDFSRAALPTFPPERRAEIVESVIGALRDLVPEEAVDVAAVLPGELRQLWKVAIPH